ncbi:hypothetical protein SAMN02910358_00474 [Lachnospiraceae bacterium XBB1006]|nr:hypothetical protein SAMN02910358_00474 [Lachnospiraceae bacterium XBB1006]
MAVSRISSNSDSAMELILSLREIRNTVRDERKKRLAKEPAKTRLTYHSGQEVRAGSRPGTGSRSNNRGSSSMSFARSRRKK